MPATRILVPHDAGTWREAQLLGQHRPARPGGRTYVEQYLAQRNTRRGRPTGRHRRVEQPTSTSGRFLAS
jgi:hypothetical protein